MVEPVSPSALAAAAKDGLSQRSGPAKRVVIVGAGMAGLVAGFALRPGWPRLADYDGWCTAAGLTLTDRWATWDRRPYTDGDYAVSVHTSGS